MKGCGEGRRDHCEREKMGAQDMLERAIGEEDLAVYRNQDMMMYFFDRRMWIHGRRYSKQKNLQEESHGDDSADEKMRKNRLQSAEEKA